MGVKASKFDAKNIRRRHLYKTNEVVRKKRIQHAVDAKNKKKSQQVIQDDPIINTDSHIIVAEQKRTGLFTSFKNFLCRLLNG